MKKCNFEPCSFDSFSNGYCQRHQYLRTDDKWLNKAQNKTVQPRSPIRRYKLPTLNEQGLKTPQTTKTELLFSFGFKNQKEMFDFIWSSREHICQISGSNLDLVPKSRRHWCMAHIIPKSLYPYFKLKEDNILLLHPDVHGMVDNFTEDLREKHKEVNFILWFALQEQKKIEYKKFLEDNLL